MNKASGLRKMASGAWSWIGPGGNWKLVLGAITALAILGYIVSLKLNLAASRQGRAEDARVVAEADAGAVRVSSEARGASNLARSSDRSQIATDQTKRRETLDAALKANRDWASQPVPADVINSLQ